MAATATAPAPHRKATDSVLSRLNVKFKNRQRRRIRELLKLDNRVHQVSAEVLFQRVKSREPSSPLTVNDMHFIVQEFVRITERENHKRMSAIPATVLSFDALVDCLLMPNLLELVDQQMYNRVRIFQDTMMTVTVGEVVDEATRGALEKEVLHDHLGQRWESVLNSFVAVSVVVSIVTMGTSIDFYEGHWGWIVLEGLCACVFVIEMLVKVFMFGPMEYLCGYHWKWNVLDMSVTMLSLAELSLSLVETIEKDNLRSGSSTTVGTARIGLILRCLRFTRVLRLIKLLHSPWLRELANMMVGCVIGVAPLIWVLVLFLLILFMAGLGFRIVLGPGKYQDEIGRCGMGDDFIPSASNLDCKLHWMYAEEFFPSVKVSMFTAFRFMIGDYSTKEGKSLAVIFSRAYGDRFHLAFCTGMIMVMFGFFNIITAIFVDTVITGLKHNDTKRKYARQYERRYVKQKLMDLLDKVAICLREKRAGIQPGRRTSARGSRGSTLLPGGWFGNGNRHESEDHAVEDLTLTEEDFMEVMDDPMVRSVLIDLDCAIPDPSAVFDTFDPDDSGEVTAAELVQAVLKLRGEPAKNDMVAAWVALRQLHVKLDHVQMMLIEAGDPESEPGSRPTPAPAPGRGSAAAARALPWGEGLG